MGIVSKDYNGKTFTTIQRKDDIKPGEGAYFWPTYAGDYVVRCDAISSTGDRPRADVVNYLYLNLGDSGLPE